MVQVSTFLMWTKEGDGDSTAGTDSAFEAFTDFYQGEVRA
jgi:hypothetical protein